MRNEKHWLLADQKAAAEETDGKAETMLSPQEVRGVAGRLRPYRDVRSGFEPWRRLALAEWTAREESPTVH